MKQDNVCVGIVCYFPDIQKLQLLLSSLESQVSRIIIYNNGGLNSSSIGDMLTNPHCLVVLGSSENVGVATALNEICSVALNHGVTHLVTFDQDSAPDSNLVDRLLSFSLSLPKQQQVAAVGPYFIDHRNRNALFPILQEGTWWVKKAYPNPADNAAIQTTLLITSGMLLNLSAWQQIGRFRDDYFIDHVDTEWCLRAHRLGFKLYVDSGTIMEHELSDEPPKRVFGRLVLKYAPIRRYYTFRNSVALILDRHVPRGNRLYLLATIGYRFFVNILVDNAKLRSLKAMMLGVFHGITGKMERFDGRL
ncbi:MAG: glycosyltransferase family 2 protein [Desulfobacter sp.]